MRAARFAGAFILSLLGGVWSWAVPATAQSCLPVPSGLTAWWPGDGNAVDVAGNRNGTLQGDATFASGLVNQAFQLDGSGDFIEVPHHSDLNVGTADFTVDLWVRFNSTSGEQVLIEKWVDGAGASGWTLTKLSGNQIHLAKAGGGNLTSPSMSLPLHTWMHFAARREGSTLTVFLNGNPIVSGSVSSNLDSPASLKIGRRGDSRGFYLNGRIDEVHFFVGRALSNAEIEGIHAAGAAGLCGVCGDGQRQGSEECDDGNLVNGDGCEEDCTLSCGNGIQTGGEECDDGNSVDGDSCDSNCTVTRCGNGIPTGSEECDDGNLSDEDACKTDCNANVCGDGAHNPDAEECDDGNSIETDGCRSDCTIGEVCIAPLANLLSWWPGDDNGADIFGARNGVLRNGASHAAGKVGSAFALDGTNDFVDIPSHPSLNVGAGDFTVDLWVRFESTAGEQVLIEKYIEKFHPAASSGWTLTKLDSNRLRFVTKLHSVDSNRLTLPEKSWMHFAARRRGAELSLFWNGARVGKANATAAVDLSSSASLKLGHRGDPGDTPGSTDTRGFFLKGRIDEVHLFGRALSDAEILAVYRTGIAGLCVPTPVCGNGLTEAGEVCDDGNAAPDDGCEADCTSSCGNGVTGVGEECDDGNGVEGDGCDNNCTVSRCGNGAVAPSEECDDGNLLDDDGCDSNCTLSVCGNGIRTPSSGEECDDGNLDDGDGCDSDCTMTTVIETVPPGGTVTTDPDGNGATPQAPLQVSLRTPDGGTVSIASSNQPLSVAGVQALIRELLIEAPPATASAPLEIVILIDASAIPEGIDLMQIDMSRNGINLPNCSGAPGVAAPDPCLQSRERLTDEDVKLTALTSHASRWNAVVRGLTKGEQKCVNAGNQAAVRVAKAQASLNLACLRKAAAGKVADAQACLTSDDGGTVRKATSKTERQLTRLCAAAPPFGFTSATAINGAAYQGKLDLIADLFGSNLNGAVTSDKAVSACQTATLQGIDRAFHRKLNLFHACVAKGVAARSAPFISAASLAACFGTVDADVDSKAAKSMAKLAVLLLKRCPGMLAADALPGACRTAGDLPYCLETRADCRLCLMLNAANGMAHNCDRYDDGQLNGSCP